MKKNFISLFCVLIALVNITGCSVYKAASNDGVAVSDIEDCKQRGCLLSAGMDIVDRKEEPNGDYVEISKAVARKSGLNYARAAGHGVLDVMTLGLWEIAGTPVEGAISNNRGYIVAKATYCNRCSEDIKKLEIYDASGEKVK
jgi:hypothetical protein